MLSYLVTHLQVQSALAALPIRLRRSALLMRVQTGIKSLAKAVPDVVQQQQQPQFHHHRHGQHGMVSGCFIIIIIIIIITRQRS
jgi:hypothetical protein